MVQRRKKTLKTNLTPSRKNRRHQLRQARRLDVLDEISTRCQRAITLAELLEACGRCAGAEPLAASVVTGAGKLILVEVRAMEELLKTIWPEAVR